MSSARKITVKGRLVELDGDEMTRVIWKLIKDLALLIGPDQQWQHTGQFLDSIAENLDKAVAGLSG